MADFLLEANSFNRRGEGSPDGSADHGAAAHARTQGSPKTDQERAVTGLTDQAAAHQYTEGSGPSGPRYEGGLSAASVHTVDFSRLEKKEDRAEQATNLFGQALLLAPPGVFLDDVEEKKDSDDEW